MAAIVLVVALMVLFVFTLVASTATVTRDLIEQARSRALYRRAHPSAASAGRHSHAT
jgi:hypothetical protein